VPALQVKGAACHWRLEAAGRGPHSVARHGVAMMLPDVQSGTRLRALTQAPEWQQVLARAGEGPRRRVAGVLCRQSSGRYFLARLPSTFQWQQWV
jgi:hypothetical protein